MTHVVDIETRLKSADPVVRELYDVLEPLRLQSAKGNVNIKPYYSKVEEIINKRFGFNGRVHRANPNVSPFYIMHPLYTLANPLVPTLDSLADAQYKDSDLEEVLKKNYKGLKNKSKGAVNLDTYKVSGFYSELQLNIYMNHEFAFDGMGFSTLELIAILLHEVGHALTHMFYDSRFTRFNMELYDSLKLKGNDRKKNTSILMEKGLDKEDIDKIYNGEYMAIGTAVIKMMRKDILKHSSLSLHRVVDQSQSEALAESVVADMGLSVEIVSTRHRLERTFGGFSPNLTASASLLVLTLFSSLAVAFPIAAILSIMQLVAIYFGFNTARTDHTYKDTRSMMVDIYNRTMANAKKMTLTSEDKKRILADLEEMRRLISEVSGPDSFLHAAVNVISKDSRNAKAAIKQQEALRSLANNETFTAYLEYTKGDNDASTFNS